MAPKKTSPNLEVISEGVEETLEKRKHPRVTFGQIQFRCDDHGKIFSVWDLSKTGLGIRIIDPSDLVIFSVGRTVSGVINLGDEKFRVQIQIVRVGRSLIGAKIEKFDHHFEAALDEYLSPESIGRQIHLIPSEQLNHQIWAHGPAGVDLLIQKQSQKSEIRQFILYFMGGFVRWTEENGLETGWVIHADETAQNMGVLEYEPVYLKPEKTASKDKIHFATLLLKYANLPETIKTQSLQLLT